MEQVISPLEAADALALAELEAEARAATEPMRGGAAHLAETPPVGDWGTLLGDPHRPVWVALIDGVPVGYLELAVVGQTARVRQVWVHPEARELGFGDELLAHALDAARSLGCTVLEGTALPGDRDTKNLYERAGITARKIVLSTRLSDPSTEVHASR